MDNGKKSNTKQERLLDVNDLNALCLSNPLELLWSLITCMLTKPETECDCEAQHIIIYPNYISL